MVSDQNPPEHTGGAEQRTGNQTHGAPVRGVTEAINPEPEIDHPKNKWWQQPKRIDHIIQTLTLLFVGSYTIITLCLFLNTREANRVQLTKLTESVHEAQRQADAAFGDQRPWLRVSLTLTGLRFLQNTDAEISFKFDSKNVGRSPARNIRRRFSGSIAGPDNAINSIPDQKRQCELAKRDAIQVNFPGAILFAGENAADVAGALNLASNGRIIVMHDAYPTGGPAPGRFTLQIVGCFDYTLPSGEHGQTGFIYTLAKNMNGIPYLFTPIPGIVRLDEMLFQHDPFSGGYFE